MKRYYINSRLKIFSTWCAAVAVGVMLNSELEASYQVETIAGGVVQEGTVDGVGSAARFSLPQMLSIDSSGNLYVPDINISLPWDQYYPVRKIEAAGSAYSVSTLGYVPHGLEFPVSTATLYKGNILVADSFGSIGILYEDGSKTDIRSGDWAYNVSNFVVDAVDDIYFTDNNQNYVGLITSEGAVSTFVSGLNTPQGITMDTFGNLYVTNRGDNTIKKITPTGTISTIAGLAGSAGSSDGLGSAALFNNPWGITADAAGNLYVVDQGNNTIRKLTNNSGVYTVSTIAGLAGSAGSSDGLGSAALFNNPTGIAVDTLGNVYVSDTGNHTIRRLFLPPTPIPVLEINFTNGAEMAAPVIGKVEFAGNSSSDVCTFSGSATDDVQVTQGKVAINSGTVVASGKSMRMNGGNLIATADFELPIIAMDQAGTLEVNTNGTIGLQALTGSGALTIATTNSGTGNVHLKDLSANTGGIAACSQPVLIDSATKFPGNTCAIEGVVAVDAAPAQASTHNLTFGEIAATSANTAANSLTSATLYATKIHIGAKDWAHAVTAH